MHRSSGNPRNLRAVPIAAAIVPHGAVLRPRRETSAPKRKVLHVFSRLNRGGAEMRTIDLLRQDALSEFEFHFATLDAEPGTLDAEVARLGGFIHPCRLSGLGFSGRFKRLLRELKCEIVHAHTHDFSGYLLRLAAQAGVATRIAHYRSTGDGKPATLARRCQRRLMRYWIDKHATVIAAVSEGTMREAWRTAWTLDQRCQVIYSGVDLRRFSEAPDRSGVRRELNLPSDAVLIIHVGSMSAVKNQARLIGIFEECRRLEPRARLLLVGRDGSGIAGRLRHDARSRGLAGLVTFAGERDDVARLLQAADLMIFPSLREGLPGAVVEACAAGIPVVASDLSGLREIADVCSLVTCIPVSADDRIWADAAHRALTTERRTELEGGRFDADAAARRFAGLYRDRSPAA